MRAWVKFSEVCSKLSEQFVRFQTIYPPPHALFIEHIFYFSFTESMLITNLADFNLLFGLESSYYNKTILLHNLALGKKKELELTELKA
jgi:hypothetical protein